jgi:hypothetical protein
MKKVIAVSVVVLALVGSSATADIFQGFQHQVGIAGNLLWNTGVGGANLDLAVGVTNTQIATGVLSTATQTLVGDFTSAAHGGGAGANILGAVQITSLGLDGGSAFGLTTFPGQVQDVSANVGPMAQSQGVGIASLQGVSRGAGPGGVEAESGASMAQTQIGTNNLGAMTELSTITAAQEAETGGESTGVGVVNTSIAVATAQLQVIN